MISLFVSLLIPILATYFLISTLFCEKASSKAFIAMKIALSFGGACGLVSYFYFIGLILNGEPGWNYFVLEFTFFVLTGFSTAYIYYIRNTSNEIIGFQSQGKNNRFTNLIVYSFCTVSLFWLLAFLFRTLCRPYGFEDAWQTWNLRAKFLYGLGDNWFEVFTIPDITMPDYPLLIPLNIARLWYYQSGSDQIAPIVIGFLFTFFTACLLLSSLAHLKSKMQALLAGFVLLGTWDFLRWGSGQIADVPVGYYILSTFVLLSLCDLRPQFRLRYIFLAGFMTGLTAWTKNEGILFLISLISARGIIMIYKHGLKVFFLELSVFLCGAAGPILILFYFKSGYAHSNVIFADQKLDMVLNRLTDVSRYFFVGKAVFLNLVKSAKIWLIVLPLCYLAFGKSKNTLYNTSIMTCLITLMLVLSGYFFIYIIIPYDMDYYTRTSATRLLMHVWPGFLFMFFLHIATFEEIVEK